MGDRFDQTFANANGSTTTQFVDGQTFLSGNNTNKIVNGLAAVDLSLSRDVIYLNNLSLEIDSNSNGTPDGWLFEAYEGGSGGMDAANSQHGGSCFKMVHPGGTDKGGGTLTSPFYPVGWNSLNSLGFYLHSTAAGMKNEIVVKYYDKDQALVSELSLYSSTANPTTATHHLYEFPAVPATARFFKLILIGGKNDTDVAGTTYFDGLEINPPINSLLLAPSIKLIPITISSATAADAYYTDKGTYSVGVKSNFKYKNSKMLMTVSVPVEVNCSTGYTGYGRLKIGAAYSNEISISSDAWTTRTFTFTTYEFPVSVILQLRVATAGIMYLRKTTDTSITAVASYNFN